MGVKPLASMLNHNIPATAGSPMHEH